MDDTPIQGPLYHKFDTGIEAQVPSGRGDAEVADDAAKVAEDGNAASSRYGPRASPPDRSRVISRRIRANEVPRRGPDGVDQR